MSGQFCLNMTTRMTFAPREDAARIPLAMACSAASALKMFSPGFQMPAMEGHQNAVLIRLLSQVCGPRTLRDIRALPDHLQLHAGQPRNLRGQIKDTLPRL